MPYLRLYSPWLPLEQKSVIAQKLIEITLRTFLLRPDERNRITIQFITMPQVGPVELLEPVIPPEADITLEVMAHDLTEGKKKAFTDEAAAMVAHLIPVKTWSRITRLLGFKPDRLPHLAFQFNDLSPAIRDPFVMNPERRVA